MARDDPTELPVRVLARRLREGQLTATAALDAYLDRIAKRNPSLNAVVSLETDRAGTRRRRPTQPGGRETSGGRCTACR